MGFVVGAGALAVILLLLVGPAVGAATSVADAVAAADGGRVRRLWLSAAAAAVVGAGLAVAAVGDGTPWLLMIGRTTSRSAGDLSTDAIERSLAVGGWSMVSVWLRSMLFSWAAGVPFGFLDVRATARRASSRSGQHDRN